jgi:hypothetical protein
MKQQTEPQFNKHINRYGCYFFCLLRISEIEADDNLTDEEVIMLYEEAVAGYYMKPTCYIQKPDKIIESALMKCCSMKDIHQIGVHDYKTNKTEYWQWVHTMYGRCPAVKYIVRQFKTENDTHFVLFDEKGEELYDPNKEVKRLDPIKDVYYREI